MTSALRVAIAVLVVGVGGPFCGALQGQVEVSAASGVEKIPLLPPGEGNPRNSEGDFIQLKDGRLLFIYTHFTTQGAMDDGAAYLASRVSSDGGATWSREDVTVLKNEGTQNIMSVSLLRLADGRIALFYMRKNSPVDCRPLMRISEDEGETWSEARLCVGEDDIGYYVLNNDRVVQLKSGRLVIPLALHNRPGWGEGAWDDRILCYLSDDLGKTWRRSKDERKTTTADGRRVSTQEPGVVELKDGRLMLYCRTDQGSQYVSHSPDGGETWPKLKPSGLRSPLSPATIKRIPATGELLVVWNDYGGSALKGDGPRTPLHVAVSRDEGEHWEGTRVLEDDPEGHFCYTAVEFVGPNVVLGYCAGKAAHGLEFTQITRFPLEWLSRK